MATEKMATFTLWVNVYSSKSRSVVSPSSGVSSLRIWSTMPCTARLSRRNVGGRPTRTDCRTSRATATERA